MTYKLSWSVIPTKTGKNITKHLVPLVKLYIDKTTTKTIYLCQSAQITFLGCLRRSVQCRLSLTSLWGPEVLWNITGEGGPVSIEQRSTDWPGESLWSLIIGLDRHGTQRWTGLGQWTTTRPWPYQAFIYFWLLFLWFWFLTFLGFWLLIVVCSCAFDLIFVDVTCCVYRFWLID